LPPAVRTVTQIWKLIDVQMNSVGTSPLSSRTRSI